MVEVQLFQFDWNNKIWMKLNGFLHTSCLIVAKINNQFKMYIKMRGGINRSPIIRKKASEIIPDS